MMRTPPAAFVGLLLLGLGSGAGAQDDDLESHPLRADLVDTPKAALFKISSVFKDFPDGTLLNVDLLVENADSARSVKAASFRVRVDGGAFAAEKAFPHQRWAPLIYRARVELQVGKQRKGVRDWFLREMGLGAGEQVVLAQVVTKYGSEAERVEFRRATLEEMRGQMLELKGLLGAVKKAISKPRSKQPGWEAKRDAARKPLLEFDARVRKYLRQRVAWHEQRLIEALRGTTRYLFQVLTMHFDKGNAAQSKRMLARAKHELKVGLQRLKGRASKGGEGDK